MAAASLWEREEGRGGAAEDGEGGKMRDEEGDVGLGVLTTQPREEKGGRAGESDRCHLARIQQHTHVCTYLQCCHRGGPKSPPLS